MGEVWGWADIHCHPMADMAFGGFLYGRPVGNIEAALSPCDGRGHGSGTRGAIESLKMTDGDLTAGGNFRVDHFHLPDGYPYFNGWPRQGRAHQQMYVDWIRRAWEGGLRLMVAHAVDSMMLRRLRIYDPPSAGTGRELWRLGLPSDWLINDWLHSSLRQQINGIKEMVRSQDFMELATSPEQARDIIRSGRLAVVLGVEVDNLVRPTVNFEPALEKDKYGGTRYGPSSTPGLDVSEFRSTILNPLFNDGVRHIFPIHLTDNWFGGSALYSTSNEEDFFNTSNEYITGHFWEVADGLDPNNDPVVPASPQITQVLVQFHLLETQKVAVFSSGVWDTLGSLIGVSRQENAPFNRINKPEYRRSLFNSHINARGLTTNGVQGIMSMMAKGMIIEIDHMGLRSANQTLDLAERIVHRSGERGYPLVSGHTSFRELRLRPGTGDGETTDRSQWPGENDLSPRQIERIRVLGGMIAPVTNPSKVRTYSGQVRNSPLTFPFWSGTSRSFAQNYLYAVDKMRGRGVAIGTDFNGLNGKPGPRFARGHTDTRILSGGLARDRYFPPVEDNNPIVYQPFPTVFESEHRVSPGPAANTPPLRIHYINSQNRRTAFDYNTNGLVHYGLLPDFIQDLKNIGVTDQQLAPLFRSAEDYIQMWEKCVRMSEAEILLTWR